MSGLKDKKLYIKDMKLTDFAFLVNPGHLDEESFMPIPVYVGDKMISLDSDSDLDLRILKQNKIDEEDIEKLEEQNLKDLRNILVDAIQVSIPEDHLYYKQEGFL